MNEMNTPIRPPNPGLRLVAAILLLALGVVATTDLNQSADASILPASLREIVFFGPALLALGLLLLVRCCAWGRRICSRRNVLITGIALLSISAAYFIYVQATERGGDASWANGMLAVMGIILVGMPGLFLTVGALLIGRNRPDSAS